MDTNVKKYVWLSKFYKNQTQNTNIALNGKYTQFLYYCSYRSR